MSPEAAKLITDYTATGSPYALDAFITSLEANDRRWQTTLRAVDTSEICVSVHYDEIGPDVIEDSEEFTVFIDAAMQPEGDAKP